MISNLLDHSADMIAASLTMSQERFEVVDYLPPIGMETYTIVIKAVDSEEISWLTFKRPLRYETWIFMIAVALIFTFTIHLSAKLLVMENKNGLEVNEHFMTHLIPITICFCASTHITLFENYQKCRIYTFSPIFVLLLFDCKLQFFKNSPN